MPINPSAAANAYAGAAKLLGGAAQAAEKSAASGQLGGFADMVKTAIEATSESGKIAEAKAADMAAGNTDIVDLVTAVAETELAVQSMVTVRDRVISAYQEIMRMPI